MRRVFSLFAISCLIALIVMPTSASARVGGTAISNCTELQAIADGPADADYHLVNDIDCNAASLTPFDWTTVPQNPIGYSGTLDGNNFTIDDFEIIASGADHAALFIYMNGATIRDLKIDNANIQAIQSAATLAITIKNSQVTNVHSGSSTGVSSATKGAGGLFVEASESIVDASSSSGTVSGFENVGGLIGYQNSLGTGTSVTKNSWSDAFVGAVGTTGLHFTSVGGLVGKLSAQGYGENANATIENSFASGNVIASDNDEVGGLVGTFYVSSESFGATSTIVKSYASGSVDGDQKVGGLIGGARDLNAANAHLIVEDSFTVSPLTGEGALGGIIGEVTNSDHEVEMSNVHWGGDSTNIDGFDYCLGNTDYHVGCTIFDDSGANADHWEANDDVAPLDEWDFDNSDWEINDGGLPILNHDDDEDGATTNQENAALNDGDVNDNNIPDTDEDNVASLFGFDLAQTVITDNGYLHGVSIQPTQYYPAWPIPYGAIDFMIFIDDGDTANIQIIFVTDQLASEFTPIKISTVDGSVRVLDGTLTDGTLDGQHYVKLSYSATDGGLNDQDLEENGIIVDPVTISPTVQTASATTTTQIIAPTAAGTLPATGNSSSTQLPWAVGLVVVGLGVITAKKRMLSIH